MALGEIGRRSEKARLRAVLKQSRRDRGPVVAVVRGEPGSGKSTLLDAFGVEASVAGFRVAVVRGTGAEDRPYSAANRLIAQLQADDAKLAEVQHRTPGGDDRGGPVAAVPTEWDGHLPPLGKPGSPPRGRGHHPAHHDLSHPRHRQPGGRSAHLRGHRRPRRRRAGRDGDTAPGHLPVQLRAAGPGGPRRVSRRTHPPATGHARPGPGSRRTPAGRPPGARSHPVPDVHPHPVRHGPAHSRLHRRTGRPPAVPAHRRRRG